MAAIQMSVRTRVEIRPINDTSTGTRARVLLGDATGDVATVDVTGGLVGALAHALWQARGGDSMTNWADAEAALDQLFGAQPAPTRSEIKPSMPARTPAPTIPAVKSGVGARTTTRR